MSGPKPTAVILTEARRKGLGAVVRRHPSTQPAALRARIVLATAGGLNDSQVARPLGISIPTARTWRDRWPGLQAIPEDDPGLDDRLADAPRRGRPPRITAEQVCQVVAPACEAPATSGRPITHRTGREVADEVVKRGSIERSSLVMRGDFRRPRDLKPPLVRQWLTPNHDEGFDAAAAASCALCLEAPELASKGDRVVSTDESTGVQALGRLHPGRPMAPGQVARSWRPSSTPTGRWPGR